MKPKKEVEDSDNVKGQIMALKCDMKSKEERVKREKQHKNERISVRGNTWLEFQNRAYEKEKEKS